MADQQLRFRGSQLQDRIRRFTRVEKAFYGSIVLTGIIPVSYTHLRQRTNSEI